MQFYRSFPRPPEVEEKDVDLLVRKYRDPERAGLLNYLNLHHDIVAIGQRLAQDDLTSLTQVTNASDYLAPMVRIGSLLVPVFPQEEQLSIF